MDLALDNNILPPWGLCPTIQVLASVMFSLDESVVKGLLFAYD